MIPTRTLGGMRVKFSLLFPAMLTLLCTQQSGRMTAWCLLAAVMHECGHLAVLCCVHNKPREIRFSAFGMCLVLNETPMRTRQQILVALGGPFVNLLTAGVLYITGGHAALIAIHLLLGGMNLLPIWPLDGGQCLPESKFSAVISYAVLCLLSALAICLTVMRNISLLLVCGYLWYRNITRNVAC